MTRSRYLLARLAQSFGFTFHVKHSTNAASEQHLLHEAEEVLGRLCWQDIEEIDELSVEYWKLRKYVKEHASLLEEIELASDALQQSHDERVGLMRQVVDSTKDLVADREELISKSERLNSERDTIVQDARAVKRRHDGIKAKLQVLTEEGGENAKGLAETNEELSDLKQKFTTLKSRRNELTAKIDELDAAIEQLGKDIEARRSNLRDEALGSYQTIGKANRDISTCRAELGVVEKGMAILFCEVGRFVAINASYDNCREIAHPHLGLIHQMAALQQSIEMNNHLAGRAGPPGSEELP